MSEEESRCSPSSKQERVTAGERGVQGVLGRDYCGTHRARGDLSRLRSVAEMWTREQEGKLCKFMLLCEGQRAVLDTFRAQEEDCPG